MRCLSVRLDRTVKMFMRPVSIRGHSFSSDSIKEKISSALTKDFLKPLKMPNKIVFFDFEELPFRQTNKKSI
jgi:hypothetical protein